MKVSDNKFSGVADRKIFYGRFQSKWSPFWWFCLAVLIVTSGAKMFWLWDSARADDVPDPVVPGVSLAQTTLLAILIEMAVVCFLFVWRSDALRSVTLLWWSLVVFSYRHWYPETVAGKHCPCFGNIPDLLGLSESLASLTARAMLQCIAFGSLFIFSISMWSWWQSRAVQRFRRTKGTAHFAVVGLFIFFGVKSSLDAESLLMLRGELNRARYLFHESAVVTESNKFEMLLDEMGVKVAIHLRVLQNPHNKEPRVLEFVYRSDGIQSVSHGIFDTNVIFPDDYVYPRKINGEWLRVTNDTPRVLDHVGQVIVNPYPFPSEMLSHAIPLCLAFNWNALKSYYKSKEGPELIDRGLTTRGTISMKPFEHKMFQAMSIRGLSFFATYEGASKQTNDFFVVNRFVDTEFGKLPSEFRYTRFLSAKEQEAGGGSADFLYRIEVKINEITRVRAEMPDLLATTDVVNVFDSRFALNRKDWIPVLNYRSTNGALPTIERLKGQEFFRSAVRLHANSERQASRRKIYLLLVCLATQGRAHFVDKGI